MLWPQQLLEILHFHPNSASVIEAEQLTSHGSHAEAWTTQEEAESVSF